MLRQKDEDFLFGEKNDSKRKGEADSKSYLHSLFLNMCSGTAESGHVNHLEEFPVLDDIEFATRYFYQIPEATTRICGRRECDFLANSVIFEDWKDRI